MNWQLKQMADKAAGMGGFPQWNDIVKSSNTTAGTYMSASAVSQ